MGFLFALLFPLLFIVGFGLAIRAVIKQFAAGRAHWDEAARQLGISVKQRPMQMPELLGTIDGATVSVVPRAQNNANYVDFDATYPSLGIGLKISKDSATKKIFGRLVGSDDIDIDDSAADDQLRIDGRDESAVKALMTPQTMAVLGQSFSEHPHMKITDTTVGFRVGGALKTTPEIVSHVNTLMKTVNAVRRSPIHRSMLRDVPVRTSEIATSPIHSGKHVDPFAPPRPTAGQPAVKTPAPDKRPKPSPTNEVPAQGLAEDIFLGNLMSFEVEKLFQDKYADKRVSWQGTVRSMRDYTSDHHFGETPGVKLAATIAKIKHKLYGKLKVDVVIALPSGTQLLERDDSVTVSGTLDFVDVTTRSIYLKDASLL